MSTKSEILQNISAVNEVFTLLDILKDINIALSENLSQEQYVELLTDKQDIELALDL